jgi:hypothetical protein
MMNLRCFENPHRPFGTMGNILTLLLGLQELPLLEQLPFLVLLEEQLWCRLLRPLLGPERRPWT